MENSLPFALYVDEALLSYFWWRKQAIEVHCTLGTHRLLDLCESQYDEVANIYSIYPPSIEDDLEL